MQKGGSPGWVFILGGVAPKQGRIKGGIGGRNENYSTFPEAVPPLGECQLLRTTSPSVLFEQARRRNQSVAIATILDCFQYIAGQDRSSSAEYLILRKLTTQADKEAVSQ